MTIHLPGAPVTADLQMAESEQIEEEDSWSESEMFHGRTYRTKVVQSVSST